jgi:hypothetical protein
MRASSMFFSSGDRAPVGQAFMQGMSGHMMQEPVARLEKRQCRSAARCPRLQLQDVRRAIDDALAAFDAGGIEIVLRQRARRAQGVGVRARLLRRM